MKIDDHYSLEKSRGSFLLIEKYMGKDKHGNDKQQTRETYHGTVYQALWRYVDEAVGESLNLEDIVNNIYHVLKKIDQAKALIKKEFCIEVRKEK